MTLYLTEGDVEKLLSMREAIQTVEDAMREWGTGGGTNNPRDRVQIGDHVLNVLSAGIDSMKTFGFKTYTTFTDGTRGTTHLILIYDTATGGLDAVVQAGAVTRIRTGAATAVATKYMARRDSRVLGLVGAGRIGELQLEALMESGRFERVLVYDFIPEGMKRMVAKVRERYGVDCREVPTAAEVARNSDVLVTATNSEKPVIEGEALPSGIHVNAVGANSPKRAELDPACFGRASFIVVDFKAQSMLEAGDLIRAVEAGKAEWSKVAQLPEVVSGKVSHARRDEDVTIFKSVGIAIEDIAVARFLHKKALQQGVGTQIPVA